MYIKIKLKETDMSRVYNFSAGPSVLPEKVLKIVQSEMLEHKQSGQSVVEMSHRSKEYGEIIDGAMQKLRDTLCIPQNYEVLFLQGGASLQFNMIPMNIMTKSKQADFVVTGQWASKAQKEASRYGDAREIASSKDRVFSYIPKLDVSTFNKNADYFHICSNNTIYGTAFKQLPNTGDVPIVADMSSCILSEPVDVSKYGLIFAGAQKNMGPSGLTVVIIRKDLLERTPDNVPPMLNYKIQAENGSMFNTPPTFAIYVLSLMLDWIKEDIGDLSNMKKHNQQKAAILYDFIDQSEMFSNPVDVADRSLMNVTFVTGNEQLDKLFCSQANSKGLVNLKGHRAVGGMRASIYNAMPIEGVKALVDFMSKFEKDNK